MPHEYPQNRHDNLSRGEKGRKLKVRIIGPVAN